MNCTMDNLIIGWGGRRLIQFVLKIIVIFADNFLKIGTTLPEGYNIYGLGEHKTSLRLK